MTGAGRRSYVNCAWGAFWEVPLKRLNAIIRGRKAVSPDTALRLERLFGIEAQFWLNLQLGGRAEPRQWGDDGGFGRPGVPRVAPRRTTLTA
jgi:hypothetical protein